MTGNDLMHHQPTGRLRVPAVRASFRNPSLCRPLCLRQAFIVQSQRYCGFGRQLPSRSTAAHEDEVEVPIRPFLAGRPFDPEKISDMSKALEAVCEALQLRMIDDAATRLVAEKIIELAHRGVDGVDRLRAMALQELKPSA